MKRNLQITLLLFSLFLSPVFAQQMEYHGTEASKIVKGADVVRMKNNVRLPDYFKLTPVATFALSDLAVWLKKTFTMNQQADFSRISAVKDQIGEVHYRYKETYKGFPVYDADFIVHSKNNQVFSVNGTLYDQVTEGNQVILTEEEALTYALDYYNAQQYKWQIPGEDLQLKKITGNPNATYYPKGELFLFPDNSNLEQLSHLYAYKFNVYASQPLKRAEIYVNAQNGEILFTNDLIRHADTAGTAITKYSGTQAITVDHFSESSFRLRETQRGNGIETYNMQTGTDYATAIDFTDPDDYWNNVNSAKDEVATDAHWAAEKTYDYYWIKHNRNSIDDSGFKLIMYVHYDVNYANAFWDGNEMTFGDGDATMGPLTAVDICGHEITHGLDEKTANLTYNGESGALNEGYSDIFGTCIKFFAKPATATWAMGADIGTVIRDVSNPKQYQLPDTYLGQYWYTGGGDNGGVHTNMGPISKWFYLLTAGGTGTNDNGSAYSVTGLGMDHASDIAFRALTVYETPGTNYAAARIASIQAASDLFGTCSPEVIATTNAFYAIGVGAAFTPGVTANFTSNLTSSCTVPANIQFTNGTTNGGTYVWDFGDGTGSTATNPVHAYTTGGTYTVTLFADGGTCGSDTLVKTGYILINPPATPVVANVSHCGSPYSFTLTANAPDSVRWFTAPTGGSPFFTGTSYTTPMLTNTIHYYIENQVPGAVIHGAKPDNSGGGGYYQLNYARGEVFDCTSPCILKSVLVYANSTGPRTIQLLDANQAVLLTASFNITSTGSSRVYLNYAIPAGTGLSLMGPTNPNLYRNNVTMPYPYFVGNFITITGSSYTTPNAAYYYFYDWEVIPPPCSSERKEISAYINSGNPVAAFTMTPVLLNVQFNNTTTDGNDFLWNFGDGNTSILENPSHTYTNPGTYTISLDVTNACGTNSVSHSIEVFATGIQQLYAGSELTISPNPATYLVHLTFESQYSGKLIMQLNDVLGRTVWSDMSDANGTKTVRDINTADLEKGIYTIRIQAGNKQISRKLVIE